MGPLPGGKINQKFIFIPLEMYPQSGTYTQKLYGPELDYSVKYIYIPLITDESGKRENRAEAGSNESENRAEAGSTRQPQLSDRLIGTTELLHDAGGVNS